MEETDLGVGSGGFVSVVTTVATTVAITVAT